MNFCTPYYNIIITFISHTLFRTIMVNTYKYDKKVIIILYEYKKTMIKQILQVEKNKIKTKKTNFRSKVGE